MIERGGARVPNPTIEFRRFTDESVIAHRMWYHVPRVDEVVHLDEGEGTVYEVAWADDKIVIVLK